MGLQNESVETKNQQVFGPKGERLGRPENLPQLPQVIVKLIEACNNEATDIRELAEIISTDAALTAKLLEIFSSAALNLPKAPKTIESALVYLGMDTIKNIAISVSAMQVFKINRTIPEFDMAAYWRRSYTCAILSKKIALEQNYPHPDESFLAGLLHRIGQLVLLQNFPADYLSILVNYSTSTLDRKKAEHDKFQTTTEEVSSWLFRQWGLNPLMADAVLYLTEPPEAVANALDLVKILFMANSLAKNSTDGQDLATLFPITTERLDQIVRETKQEVDTMAVNLGLPVPDSPDPSKQEDRTKSAENTLALKVKEISLFHGTLQNLLNAENIDDILTTTENGIRILFNVPRLFYFLFDEGKKLLNGWCNPDDKHHQLLDSIAIPMSNTSSLITSSLLKNQTLNSLTPHGSDTAISDIQITRLLESDGLWAVPMRAVERPIGVIVLGVNNCQRETLHTNRSLLNLFARQTAMCIQSFNHRTEYASLVHDQRMQAYTTLTQKIVHEVNNPIVIITNYLTLLSMKLPDRHPVQSELKVIDEEIHRISDLVQRLSNFSKPEIAEFERVNINELYASVLSIIQKSLFLPKKIEAGLVADPKVPPIRTDKNGLKQVLINLLKNAAEAMDNGGKVTVTTRFVPGSSKILIDEKRKTPGSIEITIQDNGPGISDDIRKKLFEPYNSTKNRENSGLGLSIVHTIIRNLNGTITCDSHSATGTCFTILLPVNSQGPVPTGMGPDSVDFQN